MAPLTKFQSRTNRLMFFVCAGPSTLLGHRTTVAVIGEDQGHRVRAISTRSCMLPWGPRGWAAGAARSQGLRPTMPNNCILDNSIEIIIAIVCRGAMAQYPLIEQSNSRKIDAAASLPKLEPIWAQDAGKNRPTASAHTE